METKPKAAAGSSPSSEQAGGFAFQFETTTELPPARNYAGNAKYDWAAFPPPKKNAKGDTEFAHSLIEGASRKTLNTSINKFLKKQKEKGEEAMEFTTRQVKDDKTDKVLGIRVYRVK